MSLELHYTAAPPPTTTAVALSRSSELDAVKAELQHLQAVVAEQAEQLERLKQEVHTTRIEVRSHTCQCPLDPHSAVAIWAEDAAWRYQVGTYVDEPSSSHGAAVAGEGSASSTRYNGTFRFSFCPTTIARHRDLGDAGPRRIIFCSFIHWAPVCRVTFALVSEKKVRKPNTALFEVNSRSHAMLLGQAGPTIHLT